MSWMESNSEVLSPSRSNDKVLYEALIRVVIDHGRGEWPPTPPDGVGCLRYLSSDACRSSHLNHDAPSELVRFYKIRLFV